TISHERGGPTRMDLSVPVEGAHASKHAVRFAAARQWVTVRDIRIRSTDQGAMAASIEDVAKLAGVSIATVSRSLRGLPDVATTTRDRVFAAARELNYVASPFAARLASGRAATVGVVVPFVHRWYFAELLGAVESVLHQAGYDLLLYNLGDMEGRQRFFEVLPVRKRVDAIVFASLGLTDDAAKVRHSLNVPIGMVGVDRVGVHSTRIDD